jgi:hypothetical protein
MEGTEGNNRIQGYCLLLSLAAHGYRERYQLSSSEIEVTKQGRCVDAAPGRPIGTRRTIRGASWRVMLQTTRHAPGHRYWDYKTQLDVTIGFRAARTKTTGT